MKNTIYIIIIIVLIIINIIQLLANNMNYLKYRENMIPNEETALAIAENILLSYHGEAVLEEKPFKIKDEGKNWVIWGTFLPNSVGRSSEIVIRKRDGKIINII